MEIDYDAYRKHIRYFMDDPEFAELKGAFIVNPEAAEMFYMSREERNNLIDIMMEECGGKVPIFAGVFGVTIAEAIQCAQDAKDRGVDGLFIFPPAGTMEVSIAIDNVNYPDTWTRWIKAIDDVLDMPIILHPAQPFSMPWGQALPTNTIQMLLDNVENIVGYKIINGIDAACFATARFLRKYPRHVACLNGGFLSYLTAEMCGLVDGSVQGAWNWDKEAFYKVNEAKKKNDLKELGEVLSRSVVPLFEYVYAGGCRIHVRYKLAVWIRGLIPHPFMIPPMAPPHREEAEALFEIISNSGLSCISREEFEHTLSRQEEILATYKV